MDICDIIIVGMGLLLGAGIVAYLKGWSIGAPICGDCGKKILGKAVCGGESYYHSTCYRNLRAGLPGKPAFDPSKPPSILPAVDRAIAQYGTAQGLAAQSPPPPSPSKPFRPARRYGTDRERWEKVEYFEPTNDEAGFKLAQPQDGEK